jgi:hypothetical protein
MNMSLVVAPIGALDAGKALAVTGARPFWSADGTAVWNGWLEGLRRIDATTGEVTRTLALPDDHFAAQGIELADGRLVVLTGPLDGSALGDGVVLYPADGGSRVELQGGSMWDVLALLPDGGAVAVAMRRENHTIDLVRVPLDGTPPTVLTQGTILARSSLAFAGRRAVWSDCFARGGLATLGDAGFTDLGRSDWTDNSIAAVPGTTRYYFVSDRTAKFTVFAADLGRPGAPAPVPLGDHSPSQIAVSADGRSIAFVERHRGLLVAPLDGSAPPRLLAPDTIDVNPSFDRHGTTIYFARTDGERTHVMAVPVAGGEPSRVTDDPRSAAEASPVVDVLAYLAPQPSGAALPMLRDLATGTERPLVPADTAEFWTQLHWSPDGTRLVAIAPNEHLVELDVATGRELRRVPVAPDMITDAAYVGDELVVARIHWTGDLWAATLAD